jgi:hypothetical protein
MVERERHVDELPITNVQGNIIAQAINANP